MNFGNGCITRNTKLAHQLIQNSQAGKLILGPRGYPDRCEQLRRRVVCTLAVSGTKGNGLSAIDKPRPKGGKRAAAEHSQNRTRQ